MMAYVPFPIFSNQTEAKKDSLVPVTNIPLEEALKKICGALVLSAGFWTCLVMPAQAAADNFVEQGTNYYRQGDFLSASAAFNWAIQKTPTDANAHYYLGNVLVKLGRLQEAQTEYREALKFCHDPKLQNYCQIALLQLVSNNSGSPQTQPAAPLSSLPPPGSQLIPVSGGGFASSGTLTQAGANAASAARPVTGKVPSPSRQQASQAIDQQADLTSAGMLNTGNAQAAEWQRDGQYRAQMARLSGNRRAQEMTGTSKYPSLYTPEEIEAVRKQADATGQDEILQAQERSARALQYAKAKVWETQAAAQNLQDQLNAPALPGSVKLKAEGTNLYVRSFDTPIINPGVPQHAQAGKLVPTLPLQATPEAGNFGRTKSGGTGSITTDENRRATVSGRVLDKDTRMQSSGSQP